MVLCTIRRPDQHSQYACRIYSSLLDSNCHSSFPSFQTRGIRPSGTTHRCLQCSCLHCPWRLRSAWSMSCDECTGQSWLHCTKWIYQLFGGAQCYCQSIWSRCALSPLKSSKSLRTRRCLGYDLAFFLSALGSVQAGDGNYFSIGGPPGESLPVASGLLGQPRGISNAHNRFEGDGSPARGDLYQL